MTRQEIFERLNEVFRDVFDDEDISVDETTTASDIEGWDSFAHVNLILSVERRFNMKFTMVEVTDMKNVGAMADILSVRAAADK
ncbi:acyl carrier protein [Synergistales bacterium]|nr:acyl carrier protein [Synergistales bacterium]